MQSDGKQKLLVVKGTTKAFGQNRVLKGVDIAVDRGEVLALIGGNGAGKGPSWRALAPGGCLPR